MYTRIDSKHHGANTQSTDRQSQFEVATFLRSNTACWVVFVGYGVKMKGRLCVTVQSAGCYFSLELTKMLSIKDRLLLSSKRSSLSLYRLRDVWALTEKQPVTGGGGGGLGVFHHDHEVPRTDLPKRTWTKRHRLHDRSSAWQTRPFKWRRPWAVLRHFYNLFFVDTRSIFSWANLPRNDLQFSPCSFHLQRALSRTCTVHAEIDGGQLHLCMTESTRLILIDWCVLTYAHAWASLQEVPSPKQCHSSQVYRFHDGHNRHKALNGLRFKVASLW